MLASCGKRGDPLPPLRPVPAPAEAVKLRQVGDRLLLEWQAPRRNEDGTTENVNLQEARILRRVLDLAALVEEQTLPAEETSEETLGMEDAGARAETPGEPSAPREPAASDRPPGEPAASRQAQQAEPVVEPAAEGEPQEGATPSVEGAPASAEPEPPKASQRPRLVIPPFPADTVELTPVPSIELGETLSYEEPVEPDWIGKRVEYAVVYENRKKRSSRLSPVVQIDPVAALPPPGGLTADVGDGFVSLRWTRPETPEELDFALYRRLESSPDYPRAPLADALTEPPFEDRDIVFGSAICYVATSRVPPPKQEEPVPAGTQGEAETEEMSAPAEPSAEAPTAETPTAETPSTEAPSTEAPSTETTEAPEEEPKGPIVPIVPPIAHPPRIESVASEELCVTPEDRFPPPAPTAVAVVPTAGGMFLTWRRVQAIDLKGYRVYRGAREEGPFQLLAEVSQASYTDTDVTAGETYFYMVTAIDNAPGANESPWSEVVSGTPE